MNLRDIVFQPLRAAAFDLPAKVRWYIFAGAGDAPEKDRRSIAVANVTGYLGAISSTSFALSFSMYNFEALKPAVIGNVISAIATAATPLVHRFGRSAAVLYLSFVFYTSLYFFVSVLGRDAGIQLNYIAASAIVVTILGVERYRLALIIVTLGLILHLSAWFNFPQGSASDALSDALRSQLYMQSATTIMIILGVVVYYILRLLETAQARSDALLLNMMPASIASRLMAAPDKRIAENHSETTVMFADLCNFTQLSAELGADRIVDLLDEVFSEFDNLAARYGVEKIKTIGDAYMVVAGAPQSRDDHANAVLNLAIDIVTATEKLGERLGRPLDVRIGIESGPVMAGVIGRTKFAYDVWGETVNVAARLQPFAGPGEIVVGAGAKERLQEKFEFSPAGRLDLRGIGPREAFNLELGD